MPPPDPWRSDGFGVGSPRVHPRAGGNHDTDVAVGPGLGAQSPAESQGDAGGAASRGPIGAQAAARSPSTERMVSRSERLGAQPTSCCQRLPSTMQRNWMWSSSGGGKLASR
jgi:hypothetical protein